LGIGIWLLTIAHSADSDMEVMSHVLVRPVLYTGSTAQLTTSHVFLTLMIA